MAKEQWKKWGIFAALVAILLSVVGLAFTGGGRIVAVEKDIESVEDNSVEDRENIKEIAVIVGKLKDDHADDYKELKDLAHESEVRDERQSTQYSAILGHMAQQTAHDTAADTRNQQMQVDIGKMQTKMDSLTKD